MLGIFMDADEREGIKYLGTCHYHKVDVVYEMLCPLCDPKNGKWESEFAKEWYLRRSRGSESLK
jgi:hypothetical protein